MSQKRPRSPSPEKSPTKTVATDSTDATTTHYLSEPIEDRSSTFIALYSPTVSAKHLQSHADFKTASHRIAAWRKPSSQRTLSLSTSSSQSRQKQSQQATIYQTGHDDDGEQYGGKRLERVLEATNTEGAVVVARWYGGILLGPVRFSHIENCAREAIGRYKTEQRRQATETAEKVGNEWVREELARTLEERDRSVRVLRDLLAEKMRGLHAGADGETGEEASSQKESSPMKTVDYAGMPLQALRRLEKARDATIAWILKEIDKVEEQQQQQNEKEQQDESAEDANGTASSPG